MSGRIELGILGASRAYKLLSAGIIPGQFELVAVCETDADEFEKYKPIFDRLGVEIVPRFTPMLEAIDNICIRRAKYGADAPDDAITPASNANEYVTDPETGERLGRVKRIDHKAILISSAHDEHANFVYKALRRGFDVLCEPPIVFTPAEAYRVERAAAVGIHAGRVVAVAEPCCFSKGVMLARSIVMSKKLGAVRFAAVERLNAYKGVADINAEIPESDEGKNKSESFGISDIKLGRVKLSDFKSIDKLVHEKKTKKPGGLHDCTEALGMLLFATDMRAKNVVMTMQSRSSDGKCEAYSLGLGLEPKSGESSPVSANADCLFGTLTSPARSTLRIYCEKGSVELVGDRVTLHDYSSGKLRSTLAVKTGQLLPGMKRKYRNEQEYREALMLAGFALRVLNISRSYCIDLYRALDISMTGIMAGRMLASGAANVSVPNLRIAEDRDRCYTDNG